MNPFVAQVRPPGARGGANPYAWLENVHSKRTQHWISHREPVDGEGAGTVFRNAPGSAAVSSSFRARARAALRTT